MCSSQSRFSLLHFVKASRLVFVCISACSKFSSCVFRFLAVTFVHNSTLTAMSSPIARLASLLRPRCCPAHAPPTRSLSSRSPVRRQPDLPAPELLSSSTALLDAFLQPTDKRALERAILLDGLRAGTGSSLSSARAAAASGGTPGVLQSAAPTAVVRKLSGPPAAAAEACTVALYGGGGGSPRPVRVEWLSPLLEGHPEANAVVEALLTLRIFYAACHADSVHACKRLDLPGGALAAAWLGSHEAGGGDPLALPLPPAPRPGTHLTSRVAAATVAAAGVGAAEAGMLKTLLGALLKGQWSGGGQVDSVLVGLRVEARAAAYVLLQLTQAHARPPGRGGGGAPPRLLCAAASVHLPARRGTFFEVETRTPSAPRAWCGGGGSPPRLPHCAGVCSGAGSGGAA